MSASRFLSLLFQSFNVSFQRNSHEKGSDEFCDSGCGKRTLFGIKKKGKRRGSMRNEVLLNNGGNFENTILKLLRGMANVKRVRSKVYTVKYLSGVYSLH